MAEVVSVNISPRKGLKKAPVNELNLIEDYGAEGDAHAQSGALRQISLLAEESIEKMKGLGMELHPGDFAENITTRGLDLASIPVGTLLRAGGSAVLEITQIGKKCHGDTCEIFRQIGDCVMPREGIFARVVKGGKVVAGDTISIA